MGKLVDRDYKSKEDWVIIQQLEVKIKQLEADKANLIGATNWKGYADIITENQRLTEAIEKLENEIKGYIGQHDSSDQ